MNLFGIFSTLSADGSFSVEQEILFLDGNFHCCSFYLFLHMKAKNTRHLWDAAPVKI